MFILLAVLIMVCFSSISGCAVGSRSSIADALKEDSLPKFKNSWLVYVVSFHCHLICSVKQYS